MFSALGSVTAVGMALILLLIVTAAVRRNRKDDSTPDTVFDPVHKGKAEYGCKYDSEEVRRTALLAKPPIDVSNLPAPNAAVAKALGDVSEARLLEHLNKFTGETAFDLNGTQVKIPSRSTFAPTLDLAFTYAENVYKALGIQVGFHSYKVRGRALRNVVAEIPGKTQPNKVLIIGSHIDSTAGAQYRAEPVAPGADDDGSGCVALFEIARILKSLNLGYTVRFVHFSGEEQGLWGSYAYSDVVAKEGKDIVGVLQIDMIGYSKSNRVDIHDGVDKNGSHALVVELVRQAKRYALQLDPVDTHNHAVDDRSDHAGFLDHGYKAVLISAEFSDEAFNPNYHSTTDRVSTLNIPYLAEVVRMVIATACELAKI